MGAGGVTVNFRPEEFNLLNSDPSWRMQFLPGCEGLGIPIITCGVCVCVGTSVQWCECGGQRTILEGHFSPVTPWDPEIEFKS